MANTKKATPVEETENLKEIESEFGIGTGKRSEDEIKLFDGDGGSSCVVLCCCCGGGGGGGAASMGKIDEEIIL